MNLDTPWRYALRALMVVLCVAALADLRPTAGRGEVLPIAVVDVSRSMGRMPQSLPEGIRARPEWVVVADGVEELVGGAEAPTIGRGRSRLAAGLVHVAETAPGADVVLLTDGRGTDGDVLAAARAVRAGGGRVFTRAPNDVLAEVGLEEARLVAGWPAPRVRVRVRASTTGQATVRLVQGRRVADTAEIDLQPGTEQEVELGDPSPPSEGGTYQVVLTPARGTPDDDAGDDRLTVGLRPERRVVLFWGLPEAASFAGTERLVVRSQREAAPEALEGADLVVMGNVPWRDLGTDGARALERFVGGGGRLLLLGGPEAYAGGGWAGTRLESRLAPLRLPRKEGNELALVFALDVSGSTQGARLAHLTEAIRRAVQGLVPGERIGILPFRGRPDTALLGPGAVGAEDETPRAELLAAVDALEARGDTNLPSAIRAAGRLVQGMPARTRRVIVLTDGDPDNPPPAEALAAEGRWLRERGIGFGAFVVGDDEAVARLRDHVARNPRDVVSVDRADELPGYLVHALGERRHDKGIVGVPKTGVALTWPEPWDAVLARPASLPTPTWVHVLEVAGDEGAVLLARLRRLGEGGYDLPFAAVRDVGAGRVAALAWGPALEQDRARRGPALEALRPWIEGLAAASDRGLQAEVDGATLRVRWPASSGAGRLLAAGGRNVTSLVEIAPGVFEGALPDEAEAGVRVRTAAEGSAVRPLHLPSRPDAEHRGAGVDHAALEAIAAAGGGEHLRAGQKSPVGRAPPGIPLAPWLLLLAGILLVIDRLGAKPDVQSSDSRGGAVVGS